MRPLPPPDMVQYRLARHYLDKLRIAAACVGQGGASLIYGLSLFDQEARNIQHWQQVAMQWNTEAEEWAHLCKEFPLAGREVLAARIHAADHLIWLEAALTTARRLQDGSAERAVLHELIIVYYRLGKIELLGQCAAQLLALGESASDALAVGWGHDGLGRFAEERGDYATAEHHYRRALEVFTELGLNAKTGSALNGLGSVAYYLGDYQNACDYFLRHLALVEAGGNKGQFCNALLAVGDALIRLRKYAEAEKYLLRAISLCRAFDFQRLLGVGLINLGTWAVAQNQLEAASHYFEEGIAAVRAAGTQRQIIYGLAMLGYTCIRQGKIDTACAHLHEGLQMARALGLPRYICHLQRNLAWAGLLRGQHDTTRQALLEALTIARALALPPELIRTLTCAAMYALQAGLPEQAAQWAGLLRDSPHLDDAWYGAVCQGTEAALGADRYRQALDAGSRLALEAVVPGIVALLQNAV